jgi:phosphoribosyl 1,2-cyclic phosphodiesterase
MHRTIGSGSSGNAIIYHGSILLDCGLPFSHIENEAKSLSIILLTHCHFDHINTSTIDKLMSLRPTLRIGCCEWMYDYVKHHKSVDVYECGKWYNYGSFRLMPVQLYHDVPNCGYKIIKDGHKIFHATDTAHLEGITAPDYDLYCLEHNYDEELHRQRILEKKERGEFSHERGGMNTHLSVQQAQNFFIANKKQDSKLVRLHETSAYY